MVSVCLSVQFSSKSHPIISATSGSVKEREKKSMGYICTYIYTTTHEERVAVIAVCGDDIV